MKIEGIITPPKGKNKSWEIELPLIGVSTQGRSRKDALAMAADAIESLVNKPNFKAVAEFTGESTCMIGSEDIITFASFILIRLRAEAKVTARGAAKALKSKSPSAYARYESGKTMPKVDTFEDLLRAINPKISLVLRAG